MLVQGDRVRFFSATCATRVHNTATKLSPPNGGTTPLGGKRYGNCRTIGECLRHNQSKQDYYCYLINISPNDAIYAIFPDPYERMESARIKAEEKRELMTEVVLPMNEIGENIIQVITTTYPIDISLLEQPPLRNEKKLNPVEQLLLNAAHGRRGNVSTPTEEWAMKRVSFEVKSN